MKCEQKVKACLYEVSLYLAENSHDYEARELHSKVVQLMDDEEFIEGRQESAAQHTEKILEKISNVK